MKNLIWFRCVYWRSTSAFNHTTNSYAKLKCVLANVLQTMKYLNELILYVIQLRLKRTKQEQANKTRISEFMPCYTAHAWNSHKCSDSFLYRENKTWKHIQYTNTSTYVHIWRRISTYASNELSWVKRNREKEGEKEKEREQKHLMACHRYRTELNETQATHVQMDIHLVEFNNDVSYCLMREFIHHTTILTFVYKIWLCWYWCTSFDRIKQMRFCLHSKFESSFGASFPVIE